MGISEMNTNGADWGGAVNKADTRIQNRTAENGLEQPLKGGVRKSGAFVPLGDGAQGGASMIQLAGKGGNKEKLSATGNDVSKNQSADEGEVQTDSVEEKIAAVKERIADLLVTIEALIPSFAKEVQSRVDPPATPATDGKASDVPADTTDREAIATALEELAQMLEEIIGLLQGNGGSDNAGETEATPSNYVVNEDSAPEADALDVFMSIFDELSDSAKREVAEILASMVFEQEGNSNLPGGGGETTIPDDGSASQDGDGGIDTSGQTGDSGADTGSAEGGGDAATSTGNGNDTVPQSDTSADSDSLGGSADSSGSTGGADTVSGADAASQGTPLDQVGIDGYYNDGIITVEEPVVIGGQTQSGAELQPGDKVTLANGDILTFHADGGGCHVQDVSTGLGRWMDLG